MPSFPGPFVFGLTGPPDPTATHLEGPIDHVPAAIARLLQQYRESPAINELVAIYVEQLNDIEVAAFEVLVAFDVEGAVGVQLDAVGAEVGQLRTGMTDASYRMAIKARILANWSRGTEAELSSIVRELLGLASSLTWEDVEPATAILSVLDPPPFALDPEYIAGNFLARAKAAGVRIFLIYLGSNASLTFTCAPGDASVISPSLGLADDAQTTGGHLAQVAGA